MTARGRARAALAVMLVLVVGAAMAAGSQSNLRFNDGVEKTGQKRPTSTAFGSVLPVDAHVLPAGGDVPQTPGDAPRFYKEDRVVRPSDIESASSSGDDTSDGESDMDSVSEMGPEPDGDSVVMRVAATGDIHGDVIAMMESIRTSGLVKILMNDGVEFEWIGGPHDRLVFTGDYVDRGPYSDTVLHLLHLLEEQAGRTPDGELHVVALLGNHEILNMLKPETTVKSLASFVHPLELLSYAGDEGCRGDDRASNRARVRQSAINAYWGAYTKCVTSLKEKLKSGRKVADALLKMNFADDSYTASLIGQSDPCPPFSTLSFKNQRLVNEVIEVYKASWGRDCRIGQWLRRHDVVAKVGDAIYMHGGLSSKMLHEDCRVLRSGPDMLTRINKLVRTALNGENFSDNDEIKCANALLNSSGPFWWRPFQAMKKREKPVVVDNIVETLRMAGANRMVVGHDIHSNKEYFSFSAPSYSERLEKPFKHDVVIGIDIALSYYITKYRNIYGAPDGNSHAGEARSAALLTEYYKYRGIRVRQLFRRGGTLELDEVLDHVIGEERDRTTGLITYGPPPEQPGGAEPSIDSAVVTRGPRNSVPRPVGLRHVPGTTRPSPDDRESVGRVSPRARELEVLRELQANVAAEKVIVCAGNRKCLSKYECMILQEVGAMLKVKGWEDNARQSRNCCDWDGVTCDGIDGVSRVVKITLEDEDLKGTISPKIAWLDKIKVLDLNTNKIHGPVPAAILALTDLNVLNLSYNQLEGELPLNWSNLGSLRSLELADNLVSGNVGELGLESLSLNHLDLANNVLTGTVPVELLDHNVSPESFRGNDVVMPKIKLKIK